MEEVVVSALAAGPQLQRDLVHVQLEAAMLQLTGLQVLPAYELEAVFGLEIFPWHGHALDLSSWKLQSLAVGSVKMGPSINGNL